MLLGYKWILWFCNIIFIFLYPYYDENMTHWTRFRQSFYLIFYIMYLTNTTRNLYSGIDLAKRLHKVSKTSKFSTFFLISVSFLKDILHVAVIKFHLWQSIDFSVKWMIFYGTAAHSSRNANKIEYVPGCVFRITRMSYIWRRLDEQSQSFRMR